MLQYTFAIIKPDAVANGDAGRILSVMEKDFKVTDLILTTWSMEVAELFYADLAEKPFFRDLVAFMTSGPLICVNLSGEDAVARWRSVIGATDPTKAHPLSIRGLFGSKTGPMMNNAVHGSDSVLSAEYETGLIRGFLSDTRPYFGDAAVKFCAHTR